MQRVGGGMEGEKNVILHDSLGDQCRAMEFREIRLFNDFFFHIEPTISSHIYCMALW